MAGTIRNVPRICGSRTFSPGPTIAESASVDQRRVLRRRAPSGRTMGHVSSSLQRASTDAYYQPEDSDLYAVPVGRRRDHQDRRHRRHHRQPQGVARWSIDRLHRRRLTGTPERSFSQSDLFVALQSDPLAEEPDREVTTSTSVAGSAAIRPRRAAARRVVPIWSADGSSIIVVAGEQGDANLIRVDVGSGQVAPVLQGRPRGAVLHGVATTPARLPRSPRRPPTSATCSSWRIRCAQAGHARQRRTCSTRSS